MLNGGEGAVDVGLARGHGVGAVVVDGQVVEGDEEAVGGEEVGEVFLRHLTSLAHEFQRTGVAGGAPQLDGVFAKGLEEGGVERGVLLREVVVEVELPVHAQLCVDVADEERFVARVFVHGGGERRAYGGGEAVEVADVVGEEVVGAFCAAFEVDGALVVVAVLVGRAPVVHIVAADVEGVADAIDGVVARAVGRGVGPAGIG